MLQRNTALEWVRENTSADEEGVIYFVDDDNTYTLEVFEEVCYQYSQDFCCVFDKD